MKNLIYLILVVMLFGLSSFANEGISEDFIEAEIAYSWFTGYSIHGTIGTLDFENSNLDVDGAEYYKITDGITKLEGLENHLLSIFSPELANDLLARDFKGHKYFIERDGMLYYTLKGIGQNDYMIGRRSFTTKDESDTKIVYELKYEMVNENVVYGTVYLEYEYEKNDEGNWVFTAFELPATKWHFQSINPKTFDANTTIAFILLISIAVVLRKKQYRS